MCSILFGFIAFCLSTAFVTAAEHSFALGIGFASYFIVMLLAPKSWFVRLRPELLPDGPRPALRSQPPTPPARSNTRHWPQREGPLPPLPERPRRR